MLIMLLHQRVKTQEMNLTLPAFHCIFFQSHQVLLSISISAMFDFYGIFIQK